MLIIVIDSIVNEDMCFVEMSMRACTSSVFCMEHMIILGRILFVGGTNALDCLITAMMRSIPHSLTPL